ncbi:DinB family protein [Azospirillum halopraeferens]|uniref:DinB family protein n=1 Tax=Azospirillum halopraeferens TaxID=34010 RepID=UPI000425C05B|nr:DinB family protein [Azospirillum halopraeferens]
MKDHFRLFARYNRWANDRLFDAVAALPEERFREDRGAFFGSLCGTLNHILVGDQLWMRRFEGAGPQPPSLDTILHPDLPGLRAAREAEDARILAFVEAQDEARFAGTLAYTNVRGERWEQPFSAVLGHLFNHQTHHRGQAHTLLSQFGHTPPELDLIYFMRE